MGSRNLFLRCSGWTGSTQKRRNIFLFPAATGKIVDSEEGWQLTCSLSWCCISPFYIPNIPFSRGASRGSARPAAPPAGGTRHCTAGALRMRTELNKPTGNAHAQSGLIFPFVSQCCRPVGAPGTAGPDTRECRGVLDYREDVSGMEFGSDGTANPIQTLAFRFCSKERCCLKGTPRPHGHGYTFHSASREWLLGALAEHLETR